MIVWGQPGIMVCRPGRSPGGQRVSVSGSTLTQTRPPLPVSSSTLTQTRPPLWVLCWYLATPSSYPTAVCTQEAAGYIELCANTTAQCLAPNKNLIKPIIKKTKS